MLYTKLFLMNNYKVYRFNYEKRTGFANTAAFNA